MVAGLDFRTTDNTKWGAGTGAGTGGKLTSSQADNDIWTLHTRVLDLEEHPPTAVSIVDITVSDEDGSQATLNMSDGSHIGPFQLPIATFRLLGNWVNAFPYKKLDFFTVPHQGLYMVLINHTSPDSPAIFDPNAVDEDSGSPTFGDPLYQLVFGEDSSIYDLAFYWPGVPGRGVDSGDFMFGHTFTRAVTLPAGLTDSVIELRTAPTADFTVTLKKESTTIGTGTILAGHTSGTFTFSAAVAFVEGDFLGVPPPALDSTAKSLSLTIRGVRQDL
jgi:hypothetical protein